MKQNPDQRRPHRALARRWSNRRPWTAPRRSGASSSSRGCAPTSSSWASTSTRSCRTPSRSPGRAGKRTSPATAAPLELKLDLQADALAPGPAGRAQRGADEPDPERHGRHAGGRHGSRSPPSHTPGREVRVTVADTGIGMPEAVRQRIFEPFFSTKGEGGSGLGLSMAYSIVQRHGGDIHVDSVAGRRHDVHAGVPRRPRVDDAGDAGAVGRGPPPVPGPGRGRQRPGAGDPGRDDAPASATRSRPRSPRPGRPRTTTPPTASTSSSPTSAWPR